jgi:fumarate hydratase class II
MNRKRMERDHFGPIEVPSEKLWGAQTQRSLIHFDISTEKIPSEFIHALALVKKACLSVNRELNLLPEKKSAPLVLAVNEILDHHHEDQFPLSVWQTGSATQTHMNINEVMANRAIQLMGGALGENHEIHPNDDVNLGQSSNDVIPTAMHVAGALEIKHKLLPALDRLTATLEQKANDFSNIIKVGRTHLQDAVPLTLGQEFSGYVAQLRLARRAIDLALPALYELAIGGTAVGTGINTPHDFGPNVSLELRELTGIPFESAPNKFAALSGHEPLVFVHGALKTLAAALMKISTDIRWMASGPRSGLGEIALPANEPGSSIMPGKVNPTQCESLAMVCVQVMGNDATIGMAASSGNFELNVFKPIILHNFLQSVRLLSDGMRSFDLHCAGGITPNIEKIRESLNNSLMLVTALTPHIGYDNAAIIVKMAFDNNSNLREAAVSSGLVSAQDFDDWVNPSKLI